MSRDRHWRQHHDLQRGERHPPPAVRVHRSRTPRRSRELDTKNDDRAGVAWPNLVDWRSQSNVFTDIGAVQGRSLTLANVEEPERLEGSAITWNLFPMLGVKPALGRLIRADEDKPGGDRVVLLSDGLWQRRFGRDPTIVGKTLMLNEIAHTVIGVMPPAFKFPEQSELWIPLRELDGREPAERQGTLHVRAAGAWGVTSTRHERR